MDDIEAIEPCGLCELPDVECDVFCLQPKLPGEDHLSAFYPAGWLAADAIIEAAAAGSVKRSFRTRAVADLKLLQLSAAQRPRLRAVLDIRRWRPWSPWNAKRLLVS